MSLPHQAPPEVDEASRAAVEALADLAEAILKHAEEPQQVRFYGEGWEAVMTFPPKAG